jgi:hypothetical protein
MNCPQCGVVDHDPIPEDEAHCGCWWPGAYYGRIVQGDYLVPERFRSPFCGCPCHTPAFDADVPDFSREELAEMDKGVQDL